MPVVAAVALPHVLGETTEVRRSGAVGVVGGDGVGHLVEGTEAAVGVAGHERLDAVGAGLLHVGDDVDEDDPSGDARLHLTGEEHRGEPSEGRTDQERRQIEGGDHRSYVLGEAGEAVVGGVGPVGSPWPRASRVMAREPLPARASAVRPTSWRVADHRAGAAPARHRAAPGPPPPGRRHEALRLDLVEDSALIRHTSRRPSVPHRLSAPSTPRRTYPGVGDVDHMGCRGTAVGQLCPQGGGEHHGRAIDGNRDRSRATPPCRRCDAESVPNSAEHSSSGRRARRRSVTMFPDRC